MAAYNISVVPHYLEPLGIHYVLKLASLCPQLPAVLVLYVAGNQCWQQLGELSLLCPDLLLHRLLLLCLDHLSSMI